MTPRTQPRQSRRARGQALVEAGLLLPLFLLMMLGVVEMGRLAYAGVVVESAAHAGALYGARNNAVASDSAGMQSAALADGHDLGSLTATATHVCTCADGGSAPDCSLGDCPGSRLLEYVQVNTTATYTPLCAYPGLPGPLTLHGQAVLKVEQ